MTGDERSPLIGYAKDREAKFGTITRISFHEKNIQQLKDNLNERGWVDLDLKTTKDGNRILELVQPKPPTGD